MFRMLPCLVLFTSAVTGQLFSRASNDSSEFEIEYPVKLPDATSAEETGRSSSDNFAICLTPYKEFGQCIPITQCPSVYKISTDTPRPLSNEVKMFLRESICGDPYQRTVCCRIQDVASHTVGLALSSEQNKNQDNAHFGSSQTSESNTDTFFSGMYSTDRISEIDSDKELTHADLQNNPTNSFPALSTPSLVSSLVMNRPPMYQQPFSTPDPIRDIKSHPNVRLLDQKKCGRVTVDGAFNGTSTKLYEFPWLAQLGYETQGVNETEWKCAASLINTRYVLTAAHCVRNLPSKMRLTTVRLGDYDMSTERQCMVVSYKYQCAPPAQDIGIEKIVVHQRFNSPARSNDIALIRLSWDANVNEFNIAPICLPISNELMSLTLPEYITTGWATRAGLSGTLMKATLAHLEPERCAQLLGIEALPGQHCVESKVRGNGCIGDPGSPLQFLVQHYYRGTKYVQFGITSYGKPNCARVGVPIVYTHVSHYMKWILDSLES